MNIINDMLVDKCFPDNANARAVVPAYKEKTTSGNPITLTDSAEWKPLNMKLYGWSKQDGEPSPENPVEIESAGMKWSTGKNLVNLDAIKNVGWAKSVSVPEPMTKLSNYVYRISMKFDLIYKKDNFQKTDVAGFGLFDADRKVLAYITTPWNDNKTVSLHVKIPNTFDWSKVFEIIIYGCGNDQVASTGYANFYNFQIEKGTEVTAYEPYTGGIPKPYGDKVGVSVRGKNLFHITKESDCDKAHDNTTKRIILPGEYITGLSQNNYHISYNASIDLNKDSISFIYSGNSGYGVGIGTNCQKNKTYVFSFETNKGVTYAVFYGEDGAYKTRVLVSKYNVFSIPDYVEHVVIVFTNNESVNVNETIWFKDIQIEEAKSITAYEPYRTPQSASLITPNGLPGIQVPSNTAGITYTDANGQAWIADEIDLERRKYVQRVWKAVFDGSENWTLYKSVQYLGFAIRVLPQKMTRRYGFCTQYKTERFPTANEAIWIGVDNDTLYVKNSRFYDELLADKGLSNFKANLAANPLVVMTYIDTPIERDLTSAELAEYTQLYSYKPTTVVENYSDCWMDVTYKAGTSGKSKNEALRWYFKNVMPLVG